MTTAELSELADVLNRVKTWPMTLRVMLVQRILESLEKGDASAAPTASRTRELSAEEIRSLLQTDRPAPDDETVERWIDQHRMEKYG